MGREAAITYEQVAAAAGEMEAEGIRPTSRAVRVRLGNIGSMGTVHKLLQRWKASQEGEIAPFDDSELRRQAENRLGERTRTVLSEEELLSLPRKVQMYQIELEMQNAELQNARNKLEAALQQYTELYDLAPVGYFTLDRNGTISRANLTGASLLGVERSRLISRNLEVYVCNISRPTLGAFLEKTFKGAKSAECELAFLNEGTPLWVQVLGAAKGPECRITLIDITERKFDITERKLAKKVIMQAKEIALAKKLAEEAREALRLVEEAQLKKCEMCQIKNAKFEQPFI